MLATCNIMLTLATYCELLVSCHSSKTLNHPDILQSGVLEAALQL